MARPIPSEDAVPYTAEVWVKFEFEIEADDDVQAEEIASYDWEEYKYRSTIERIRVQAEDACEDCDEYHEYGECGLDSPDPDALHDEMREL
jgi:hypothetical protein